MAKLCALFVLALACVVRAVRIDPPSLVRTGKYFADDVVPRTKIDDRKYLFFSFYSLKISINIFYKIWLLKYL